MQNLTFFVIFLLHFTFYYKYCQESSFESTLDLMAKKWANEENLVSTRFLRHSRAKFYHIFYLSWVNMG